MEEMKKLILFLTVVILSATISIFTKRNIEKNHVPKITFLQSEHDFDTLFYQKDAEFYFVYENSGKKDLKIENIKSSCGCTIPSWNVLPLAPYERDSFKVTYNIENKGYFIKEIMVYTNSDSSPDRLVVKGFVPFED